MRHFLSVAFVIALVATSFGQKNKISGVDSSRLAKKIYIYNASKQYNDPVITRMAIYSLLSENPNNLALRDSLALMYYEQQQFASAALVAKENVQVAPDNLFSTEIAARSFDRLGVKNRALNYYEKLYLNDSDNISHLYRMAFLQHDLKLHEEAMSSTDLLMEHKLAGEATLVFPTEDQKGQEISMELAAMRLKGMIEASKGNTDKAKEYYKQILEKKPDFQIVKQQLDDLSGENN